MDIGIDYLAQLVEHHLHYIQIIPLIRSRLAFFIITVYTVRVDLVCGSIHSTHRQSTVILHHPKLSLMEFSRGKIVKDLNGLNPMQLKLKMYLLLITMILAFHVLQLSIIKVGRYQANLVMVHL